jgi:hypothetical protein
MIVEMVHIVKWVFDSRLAEIILPASLISEAEIMKREEFD